MLTGITSVNALKPCPGTSGEQKSETEQNCIDQKNYIIEKKIK